MTNLNRFNLWKHCPPPRTGPLTVGDKVRLKRVVQPIGPRIRTRIEQFLPEICPGAVKLKDPVLGFQFWNVEDLERA